jgi:aspartate kinase
MTAPLRVPISPSRGITHLRRRSGVAHLSFAPPAPGSQTLSEVFGSLSRAGINVFFIKKSPTEVGLGVDSARGEEAAHILREAGVEAKVQSDCSVACVVASNMRDVAGVMHRIVRALNRAGVRLLSTSDSFNSVSCLVSSTDLEQAIKALGEEFGIQESPVPGLLDPW